jgi:branched-chain amino acid transport system permease protein
LSSVLNISFWSYVGAVAGIYTIFALGLQVEVGYAGIVNFGHVVFMEIAAYTMAILVVKAGLPMWVAAICALAATVISSVAIGASILRLRADYLALVTLALAEIFHYVTLNQTNWTGGAQGTAALAGPLATASYNGEWARLEGAVQRWLTHSLGSFVDNNFTMMLLVWLAVLILLPGLIAALRSPWGRVLRAIRDDEQAAAAFGKNVLMYRCQALALGSALAAVAGLFYAWQFSFFGPDDFASLVTFFAYTIIIIGGSGRAWTVPIGALVFGVIFAGTRFFGFVPFSYLSDPDRAALRLVIIGVLVITTLMFRPQGLFGKKEEIAFE